MRRTIAALGSITVAGLAVAGLGLGSGTASAGPPNNSCLWAGSNFAPGASVVAGGWRFTCAVNPKPNWNVGNRVNGPSTVANPGATGDPVSTFSPGAMQPGTDYNDYCSGNQLVPGSAAVYQVAPNGMGGLFWRPAGSIGQWTPPVTPTDSWRSGGSMCDNGSLL